MTKVKTFITKFFGKKVYSSDLDFMAFWSGFLKGGFQTPLEGRIRIPSISNPDPQLSGLKTPPRIPFQCDIHVFTGIKC